MRDAENDALGLIAVIATIAANPDAWGKQAKEVLAASSAAVAAQEATRAAEKAAEEHRKSAAADLERAVRERAHATNFAREAAAIAQMNERNAVEMAPREAALTARENRVAELEKQSKEAREKHSAEMQARQDAIAADLAAAKRLTDSYDASKHEALRRLAG
jgi:hypothetical protein